MVAHYSVYYPVWLEDLLFVKLLGGLNAKGWKSLLFQSRMTSLSLMSVRSMNEGAYQYINSGFRPNGQVHVLTCDVIIKDGCIFYLRRHHERYGASRLEVGLISSMEVDNPQLLQALLNEVDALFKKLIDGRKRRHMKLTVRLFPTKMKALERTLQGKYSRPNTDPATVAAALELATSNQFLLLRTISGKKKNRSIDVSTLQVLLDAKLVSSQEQDNTFSLTPLGHSLNTRSQWMSIWLSQLLISRGIPADSIYVGLTADGEEVDLIMEFHSQVWVFELKAGDFEPNKAYPFQYRKVKFQADRIIVIATGKISLPAKKVFASLAKDNEPSPVLIEGLKNTDSALTQLLINARMDVVNRKQRLLSEEIGMNLVPIFEHLFVKK
jgi:hypothetical protein